MTETMNGAAGASLAAPAILTVEVRPNPRSKLSCECGSGRPTIWQIVTRDARKLDCCIDCVDGVWAEKQLF